MDRLKRRGEEGDEWAGLAGRAMEIDVGPLYNIERGVLTRAEAERFRELLPEAGERYEREERQHFQEILDIASTVDPLELLTHVIFKNGLVFGDYYEPTFEGSEAKIEFAVGVLASLTVQKEAPAPNPDVIARFLDGIDAYFEAASLANATKEAAHGGDVEAQIRFMSKSHSLWVRGTSYELHGRELANAIFAPLSEQMRAHLGFDVNDVLEMAEAWMNLLQTRIDRLFGGAYQVIEALEQAAAGGDEEIGRRRAEVGEDAFRKGVLNSAIGVSIPEALIFTEDEFLATAPPVSPNALRAILKAFSLSLGEGGVSYSSAWSDNPLAHHPVVKRGDRYTIPVAALLGRELPSVLESHAGSHIRKFSERRAEVLDRLAVEAVARVLPGCSSYTSLYYRIEEAGEKKRPELDGLVLFDDVALVVEGKGSPLGRSSLRGDVARLRSEMKRTVAAAFQQGDRAAKYLLSGSAVFEDQKGDVVVEVDSEALRHVFVLNPTIHLLGENAVQLERLRALGLFTEASLPVSIFINDLRVITDACGGPAELLHYLRWRTLLPLGSRILAVDELDIFRSFQMREQFRRRLGVWKDTPIQVLGSSTDFDDYYMDLARGNKSKKPEMFTPITAVRQFVTRVEKTQAPDWLEAAGVALDLSMIELAAVGRFLADGLNVSDGDFELYVQAGDSGPFDGSSVGMEEEAVIRGGGLSLGLVALGRGTAWEEAWRHIQTSVQGVERIVFARKSIRGRGIIEWMLAQEDDDSQT